MMTYEYDPEHSVIHLRASGVLVASDPVDYFKQIDADPDFKPRAEERIYFTDLEDIRFSFCDVLSIRDAFVQYSHGDKLSRGVFIVDSDFSFGMARMVIALFGDVFANFSIQRITDSTSRPAS